MNSFAEIYDISFWHSYRSYIPYMQTKLAKKRKKRILLDHAICHLSIVPVRKYAEDPAEMVTQMLYGETCQVITRKNKSWIKVKLDYDGYVGWVDPKQLYFISGQDHALYKQSVAHSLEYAQSIISDEVSQPILMGSALPYFDGMNYKLPSGKYVFSGQVLDHRSIIMQSDLIVKVAYKYLNAPYLWGGRSAFGIDCSGFTQMVYKILGVWLPRDAYQQAEVGETVDFVDAAQVGDLAYFQNKAGKITHVGIVLEDQKIIHASGRVRVDDLDHYGIYDTHRRRYTHELRVIKRIVEL